MILKQSQFLLNCFALIFMVTTGMAQNVFPDINRGKKGIVESIADQQGNVIPDFSFAGYMASEKAIPNIKNKIFVPKQEQDATQKIQAAIDYVSNLKPDQSGFRGAILLDKGTFKISGTLYIKTSGVVLRGSGNTENGTILLGTGLKRESLIRVLGVDDKKLGDIFEFETSYTPLGIQKIQLKNASKLKTADEMQLNLIFDI